MQDNIGQVMLFSFDYFSFKHRSVVSIWFYINFELLYCKCGKEKGSGIP